jgi:hypothetical protein
MKSALTDSDHEELEGTVGHLEQPNYKDGALVSLLFFDC